MKYIENTTDNTIVFKCTVVGKEKTLVFPKKSITAVEDSLETAFQGKTAYVDMFTEGVLVYTSKETEVDRTTFYDSLIRAKLEEEDDNAGNYYLCLTMNKELAGETVVIYHIKDNGTSIETEEIDVAEDGTIDLMVGTVLDCIEFQVFNKFASVDYPTPLSYKMKVYK